MCGIGGVLYFGAAPGRDALLGAARHFNRLLAHRGPDDEGIWSDGRDCALSHRRLSVIDLSRRGRQPMRDAKGRYHITLNGEIYNHLDLRAELEQRGHRFRTRTDTEALLEGFAEFGEAVLERVDGMFAFAIYDSATRTLFLARDRAGEKPLYYAALADRFLFCSELKPLAALPELRPKLDPYGVFQYCVLRYVPPPGTILEGLSSLEPGCSLRVSGDGRLAHRRYFSFDRSPAARAPQEPEFSDAIEDALTEATRLRLASADVPVGAFLSGGIDSSLTCALAARRIGLELQTYCAGFGIPEHDETARAAQVAQALGLPHQSYRLSETDLLAVVSDFGRKLDEPNGDRSCVPVFALSGVIRRSITVAVSGDGGDELFCGYARYPAFASARAGVPPLSAPDALERYFDVALPVFGIDAAKAAFPDEYRRWRGEFLDQYAVLFLRGGWSDSQRLSVLDFHSYLPGAVLAKVDKMSMRHALEVRTPFFAPEVMRLAAQLRSEQCQTAAALKPVLRGVLARHLPGALISDRKQGFGMPASFMRAHRATFDRLFESAREALGSTDFFSGRREALQVLSRAAPGNINSLWAFTALGLWAAALGSRL